MEKTIDARILALQTMVEELNRLFDKYIEKTQQFKKANACKELVPVCELNAVASLCHLFDCLATPQYGVSIDRSLCLAFAEASLF